MGVRAESVLEYCVRKRDEGRLWHANKARHTCLNFELEMRHFRNQVEIHSIRYVDDLVIKECCYSLQCMTKTLFIVPVILLVNGREFEMMWQTKYLW